MSLGRRAPAQTVRVAMRASPRERFRQRLGRVGLVPHAFTGATKCGGAKRCRTAPPVRLAPTGVRRTSRGAGRPSSAPTPPPPLRLSADLTTLSFVIIEKREQVFVSSTFLDLQEERQAVIQTLLEADCFPAGMELFPASDEEKWDLIKRVIDDSDYYVVIIGGRYGSVDDDGLSFTEKEFDYAVETNTPVLAFLHGKPGSIIAEKTELDPKLRERLDAFREKAGRRMVKFWESPNDLAGAVARSLFQARKRHNVVGWVRASEAMTPEAKQEMADLRATVDRLTRDLTAEQGRRSEAIDISDLARGSDKLKFRTLAQYWTKGDTAEGKTYENRAHWHEKIYDNVSWDSLFKYVGPLMLDEASERKLSDELDMFAVARRQDYVDLPEDAGRWDEIVAGAEMLDKIKVQFSALGLIDHSKKRHGINDSNSYWTLTQQGREHLMRLSAARRPKPDQQGLDLGTPERTAPEGAL